MFELKQPYTPESAEEVLLVGLFKEPKITGPAKEIDEKLGGLITELMRSGDISSKAKTVSKLHTLGKIGAKRIFFIGLGKKESLTYGMLRSSLGKAFQQLKNEKRTSAGIVMETFDNGTLTQDRIAHALGDAAVCATYSFADYKQKTNEPEKRLENVTVYAQQEAQTGLLTGYAYGKGIEKARNLVNTPANLMTPADLAAEAIDIALEYGMDYEVLEQEDMEKLGMGAILAVSQGSSQPPKLITVKYKGTERWENVLCFVGKGLTFDSGGYSIKPAASMPEMKSDMGGSASVIGAMEAIGRLKPKANIMFIIPSSENLINGSAMKPGDVITSLSGKTIEVRNTDAEGRLILADAVTYAKEQGASYIVDIATLTAGVSIALGDCTTGALTNNDTLFSKVKEAAEEEEELIWLMPSFQPYKDMLKSSDVADLNNSPGRLAQMITGGLFVGEFAGETPWVHLDIAGTAYSGKSSDLGPKGATGVMVRTLCTLAREFQK
ncbi:leucyl aminopeptidase [Fictibacillus aquaticus]|uniref:Probable cytosol aminopeptidase n=1 Tax=Fictibacillus aquaticus TaxID=2021314 RepID=A0A235F560_9BACL|nr:leucyl aminopeptidase [Fictibacillus aquaticus]OYD56358.1 leucyl aminopeptidase [Fictibacillus aquaticus]